MKIVLDNMGLRLLRKIILSDPKRFALIAKIDSMTEAEVDIITSLVAQLEHQRQRQSHQRPPHPS